MEQDDSYELIPCVQVNLDLVVRSPTSFWHKAQVFDVSRMYCKKRQISLNGVVSQIALFGDKLQMTQLQITAARPAGPSGMTRVVLDRRFLSINKIIIYCNWIHPTLPLTRGSHGMLRPYVSPLCCPISIRTATPITCKIAQMNKKLAGRHFVNIKAKRVRCLNFSVR